MEPDANSGAPSETRNEFFNHIIDIDKQPEDLNTSNCNIYRVPCSLRKGPEDAYTPRLISIGPLHFGHEDLNPMQDQKRRYFLSFRSRVKDADMKDYKKFLEKEEAMRHCYPVEFPKDIGKEKLVEILLLDSVFIMELFLRISFKEEDEDDCILKQTWLNKSIQRDLLLLENQIPFSILEELYKSVVPLPYKRDQRFTDLAYDYFKCFDPDESNSSVCGSQTKNLHHKFSKNCNDHCACGSQRKSSSNRFKHEKPLHFTDLIRHLYICKHLPSPKKASSKNVLMTATKLQEAGVSFEKKEGKHLLDINFEKHRILSWFLCLGCIPKFTYFKARLQIPQLKVEHTTECVLRNLIAFEQCHYPNEPYICNYVSLIDSLIHTKDDVQLLVEKEVIVHELGSDKEVAVLVNGLCKYVVTDKTCYSKIIEKLNKHYLNMWNRTMAALRLVYFRDPWRASSTVVGIAILIFAIFNFCRIVRLFFYTIILGYCSYISSFV